MYPFKEVGGEEIIERFYSMKEAPELGMEIEHEGRKFQRILTTQLFLTPDPYQGEREDITFPKGQDLGAGLGPKGHPIIKNRQHDREICARWGMKRD